MARPVFLTHGPGNERAEASGGELSDSELIWQVAEGDFAAIEQLYRRFSPPVLGLALQLLGSPGQVEDAARETFASFWQAAKTYQPERGAGSAWLYTIARNSIAERARTHAEPTADTSPEGPSDNPGTAEDAEGHWIAWSVHTALQQLPEYERRVVELTYWEGLSQPEAARELDVPPETVETWARTALPRLSEHLEEARLSPVSETPDLQEQGGDALPGRESLKAARIDRLLRSLERPPEASAALWARVARDARRGQPQSSRARRYWTFALVVLLVVALVAAAFAIGFFVRQNGGASSSRPVTDRVILAATGDAPAQASLELAVLQIDDARNWPLLADVFGLPPLEQDEYYELWLTQEDEIAANCGQFLVDMEGNARGVRLSAPYRLLEFDDWAVVRRGADDQRSPILLTGPVAAPV